MNEVPDIIYNIQSDILEIKQALEELRTVKIPALERSIDTIHRALVSEGPGGEKPVVSEFDPEDLLDHTWKGKKLGHRKWKTGKLGGKTPVWWEFVDQFQDPTIDLLKKGPETIGQYVFSLSDNGKLVNVSKEGAK